MPELSLTLHVSQITEIVRLFIRLKPRLKTMLPEELAREKARMDGLHPQGKAEGVADYALLYNVGVILSRQPESLTMGELSKALDVPLSTATRMVDWLVTGGYVKRLSDPEDRRIVRVALTETGREAYRTGDEFVRQRVEQLLRRFTPEERENLLVLLRKLVAAIEEQE
ncbi:MAG: MarR family transcriptional regulator [Chloroflexi bacterium]|nr:MarR family transcriptional regulator [Chloroflexota bacterium]MBI3762733.1 MarR family transcriptional regulator [Chloroflexota bacterium]